MHLISINNKKMMCSLLEKPKSLVNIPTFFFHGWGSSYHVEEDMTAAIKKAGVSNTIVRVSVNKNGQAKIIGKITKNAKNPLVEVNFADNKLTNAHGSYTKYQSILFNRCKICQM